MIWVSRRRNRGICLFLKLGIWYSNPPFPPTLRHVFCYSWTTKICLPLRSESHQTRNLFHDVHPSLLLFLHRLRSITIYNQVTLTLTNVHTFWSKRKANCEISLVLCYSTCVLLQSEKRLVVMTRKDLSHNVLEVEHTEGTERWLVVKATLQPKKVMRTQRHSNYILFLLFQHCSHRSFWILWILLRKNWKVFENRHE